MNRLGLTAAGLLLAGTMGAAPGAAQAKPVHYIQCGDKPAIGVEDRIAEFERANPGEKVELEVVGWAQCEQKVTTLAAAGNAPGLAYVGSRTLPGLSENGLIVPITLTAEERASYWPAVVASITTNDKVLGLPVAMTTHALYWNKALFRQAGLDPEQPPRTWQALYDAAKAIKDKTGVAGYGMPAQTFSSTAAVFLCWVYSNGGSVLKDGRVTFDSPANLQVMEWYQKMAEVSEAGPAAYRREDIRPMFADGKIGMFMSVPSERGRINKAVEFGVATLPAGPSGASGSVIVTDSLAVFKGTGVEDVATRFAKYLTNPANQSAYEAAYGLTPMRPGPQVAELVAKDASWAPFVEGVKNAGPEPQFVDYVDFQKAIADAIQSVLLGQATPKAALVTATAKLSKQ